MKKLVLIAFLFSPLASLAGGYEIVANPEQVYKSLDVEEKTDFDQAGRTIYYKNAREYFCTRIATLVTTDDTSEYHCFHMTEADLAR
ncbi:hypothetical protein D3C87_1291880 [compost metagenome]